MAFEDRIGVASVAIIWEREKIGWRKNEAGAST
jgi:hypothetical protein